MVHVVGQLADIMLGKVTIPKYNDPESLVVGFFINGIQIKNDLIYLGEKINVMTKDIPQQLNVTSMRPTPTILKLVDSSIVKPNGLVENLVVTLDS